MHRFQDKLRETIKKGEEKMKSNINVSELQDELLDCTGYLLGVTILKDGILTHHLKTNNFPTGDIKTSMDELRKLALEDNTSKTIEIVDENN